MKNQHRHRHQHQHQHQNRRAKILGTLAPALLVFAGLVGAQAQPVPLIATATATATAAPKNAQIERGAYLAKVGDCAACHTSSKAAPLAGGLPLATPFGTLYSTNITPDAATGIGAYSYDDFAKALREGIAKDGHRLYPAMPYPSYSKINDEDMHALYRYFLEGVKPLAQANHAAALRFPFNIRALMSVWDKWYSPQDQYRPDPQQSIEWNRGAYLVQGLMHCGACHTPHGMLGQETAFDEKSNTVFLSGDTLAGWYAQNLRGHPATGTGKWNKSDLVTFLRSGRSQDGAAFGPMTEVIDESLQYLNDDDLNAMATYLTSPPLQSGGVAPPAVAAKIATSVATTAPDPVTTALRAGQIHSSGANLYLNNCNACHRSDGTGAMPTFPKLSGNVSIVGPDPSSLIHIVLSGSHMPSTAVAPTPLAMPGFGWRLSDVQVADLLTFIRSSWGNQASAVTTDQVAKIRKLTADAK